MRSALIIGVLASLLPSPTSARELTKKPVRIGNIYIVGNDVTMEFVIRQAMELRAGQALREFELRQAEKRLRDLHIFDEQEPPRIIVLGENNRPGFEDLEVYVKETTTGSFMLGAGYGPAGWQISLVLQERNFDPWRFPTSWADIDEGRAFRGGGIKMNVEVLRINLTSFPYLTNTIQFFPPKK